ncbi:MAG: SLC13 family permease [Candidatus Brocadiia bacterium]
MSTDVLIVFALLVVATVLFTTERFSFDVVAVIIMGTLMLTGILDVKEGLSGFSNRATITIAAMFVVSEGVRRTGALSAVSDFLSRLGQRSYWLGLAVMMGVVSVCSAFINNTAAVAIFIPVVVGIAQEMEVSPSKLLMPLSFAAMLGGVCTLVGTSTNLLVDSIAQDYGQSAFGMFEFAPLGLMMMAVGFAYTFLVGHRLIPARRSGASLTGDYEMREFLTDVVVQPESDHVGSTLDESTLTQDLDLDVLEVFRKDGNVSADGDHSIVRKGDVLRVRGSAREIARLMEREDVLLKPRAEWVDGDLEMGDSVLVEAVIAPEFGPGSRKVRAVDFYNRFGAVVLALRRGGRLEQEELGEVRLAAGDAVLLSVPRDRVNELKRSRAFVIASEIGLPTYRRGRMPLALAVLAGVVGAAALGVVPIVVSAVVGAAVLVVSGCVTNEEAYEAINWQVILLLAGVLPLGIAMRKTGAAQMMANLVVNLLGEIGPRAVLGGFFFLTLALTNIISNQATAALLAPIVMQAAGAMGVSARPFLMAVTYAASLSFMTPIGYQTNTLIYGAGQYKFTDFTRVGTPLDLLLWMLAIVAIPVIWPF